MNPSPQPSDRPQKHFLKGPIGLRGFPLPKSLLRHRWVFLAATCVLLAAVYFLQPSPSNEEKWAYRVGYVIGQTARSHGGSADPEELATGMGMTSGEQDWFESGFKDGRKGREARYDAPATYERLEQPDFSNLSSNVSRERTEEIMREFRRSPEELNHQPAPDSPETKSGEKSTPADYMINPLYGSEPSK